MTSERTEEQQLAYNAHMMKSLGAESMEEAACIIEAAGIQQEDMAEIMMD